MYIYILYILPSCGKKSQLELASLSAPWQHQNDTRTTIPRPNLKQTVSEFDSPKRSCFHHRHPWFDPRTGNHWLSLFRHFRISSRLGFVKSPSEKVKKCDQLELKSKKNRSKNDIYKWHLWFLMVFLRAPRVGTDHTWKPSPQKVRKHHVNSMSLFFNQVPNMEEITTEFGIPSKTWRLMITWKLNLREPGYHKWPKIQPQLPEKMVVL